MKSYQVVDGVVDLGRFKLELPDTISLEARAYLAYDTSGALPDDAGTVPMWHMRDALAPMFEMLNQQALAAYPASIEETTVGGVRCHRGNPSRSPGPP